MLNSGKVIMNGQLLRISKEGKMSCFKVLFRRRGNHKILTQDASSLMQCLREDSLECN